MKRKELLVVICILISLLLLSSCGKKAGNDAAETQGDSVQAEYIVVETANGNLKYSDQWEEFVKTEVAEENGVSDVMFSAEVNGTSYKLFEVMINGDGSKGEYVGDVHDKDGKAHKVYLKMESIEEDDSLSESEMNRLYAMQEDVNYIIENFE